MLSRTPLIISCCILYLFAVGQTRAAEFELEPEDRVVFLGDGLIEQAQYTGWIEVMLTTAFPDREVSFRNLGWSADTPAGDSRFGLSLLQAGREPADEGWKQLQAQLDLTRPTVLVLGYGMASCLEGGEAGLTQFVSSYERLLAKARELSPDVRFLFLSPLQLAGEQVKNADALKLYVNAIEKLAADYDAPFVDLTRMEASDELRKDPIHLNDRGYRMLAIEIANQLQLANQQWQSSPQTEVLRQVILRKNVWWFHRSRPANMAYVFGFRKNEQGQNAVEIPQYDELIANEERRIASLRSLKPVALEEEPPRMVSQFAEFTEQPAPEFTVGEGLEVTLWAENPQLNKPIHMNFDPQGRLWVASSEAYPMIEVGQSAPDKILVLEDSDNDGKADKSTVFAEGLLIPTGVAPGDGGVYVAQSTDLLFLKDTDGDGRADSQQRVLSGFGTEDTHHNLHTLVWGPDGRLYMNQSVYTRTDTETPHGVVRLKAGGGFRYDTRSMRMEVVFQGLWNSWGHQFDAFGQSFLTDGAGFNGVAYTFPGAKFNPTPNARRQLELISPGRYPKYASMEIIYGDSFPPEWQGTLVTCDFRANRVTRFSLLEQDAGFVTEQQDDLLRTSTSSFRPIDVKQGPDGALYIADWSNPIINHGEVDFRDPRRDRWHGRIWRVTWKNATPVQTVDFTQLSVNELLDSLKSNDRYTRDQARRVLVERGDESANALSPWLALQTDASTRLQGLWLHQALDIQQEGLLRELLTCDVPEVRAAATRVLSCWADPQAVAFEPIQAGDALALFEASVGDPHPRVRLEAVTGLARLNSAEAGLLALQALAHPMDRFLEFALAETVEKLTTPLMAVIESDRWDINAPDRQKQLEFVLTSIEPAQASHYLANRLSQTPLPRDGSGPWIALISKAGGTQELAKLYQQTLDGGFDSAASIQALDALWEAERLRRLRPPRAGQGLDRLLATDNSELTAAAIRLAGVWKEAGVLQRIADLAADTEQSSKVRAAALEAMGAIGSKEAIKALQKLASDDRAFEIRAQAIMGLANLAPQAATAPFYQLLANIEDEQQALELWRGMLRAKGTAKLLAANLPAIGLSATAARAGLRAAQDGGRDAPELLAALTPLSGMAMTAQELTPAKIQELAQLAIKKGNPACGEQIYRRKELACVTCHAIGGVGGKVGPDMTSLGASAPVDYLVESLFNPNAKIKEGFHSVKVATEDGQVVTGVEVASSATELVLRDASNQLIRIPQNEISAQAAGPSLMPTGVVDRLKLEEQIDLISFLSQLGKPGDYDASRSGVARVYQVLAGTHRVEQLGSERIISGELVQGWMPLQTNVNGDVVGTALTEMTKPPVNISLVNVYLRTVVEVANAEEAVFTFTSAKPNRLWIDGKPIEGTAGENATTYATSLDVGKHTVLLRLDARDVPDQFKLLSPNLIFATEL